MIASRRNFLIGASAFLAAPSIVRVASLMPVSVAALDVDAAILAVGDRIGALYLDTSRNTWWRVAMATGTSWSQIAMHDGKIVWGPIDILRPSDSHAQA